MNELLVMLSFLGVLFSMIPMGLGIQKTIIIVILIVILINKFNYRFPINATLMVAPYVIYLFYGAISAYWVSGSIGYVIGSLFPLLLGIVFYFHLLTIPNSSYKFDGFRKFIITLCWVQIVFSIIKLVTHGIDEKFLIGTMSHNAGQLGFLFPAIAIPLVCYFTSHNNKTLMWLLIISLVSFGIINEKRSVVFLMPAIIYTSLIANYSPSKSILQFSFAKFVIILLVSIGLIGAGASFIPSLNIDHSYGGIVDFIFLFEYALDYLTMDYGGSLQGSYAAAISDTGIQVGRITLLVSIFEWIKDSSIFVIIFGVGFGAITPSEWLGNQSDPLFNLIGTRGAISGAGLALVETGLLGLGILIYFFINLFININRLIMTGVNLSDIRWHKTIFILLCVFAYDFFFYSTVLFRILPMPIVFFALIATMTLIPKKQ